MAEGALKAGWEVWRFDQIATNVNERIKNPSEANVDYYIGLEHLDSESLKIRRWGSPSDVNATKLRFYKGDIIFARRRAYQRKLGIADFDGICSAHALVLRAKTDVVLPEFLPFFMQSDLFMNRAVKISVGSLSPTINWRTLAKQEFTLPPLEEQRRIARLLIQLHTCKQNIVTSIKSTRIMRDALIKKREQDFHLSFGFQLLENAVIAIEAGKSPNSRSIEAAKDEYGVLKVSAIGDWNFRQSENKAIKDADFKKALEVQLGDLLATRANADPTSVGRTCIVTNTRDGLMLSDKTWRLQLTQEYESSKIGVLAWTKSPIFRRHILKYLGGTEAKNISQKAFLKAPFPLCSPKIFHAFAIEIKKIYEVDLRLKTRLKQIKKLISLCTNAF